MQEKLRVAILSDNNKLYAWQQLVLENIEKSDYAQLTLSIKINDKTNPKVPWAWNILSRLDYSLFKPRPNAKLVKSSRSLFKETLEYSETSGLNLKKPNEYLVDVIINFSDSIPDKNLISHSEYGVWDLVHSAPSNIKQGPPGAWELLLGLPEIGAYLKCRTHEEKQPKILDQTFVCTDWISFSRNANSIYWHAYPMIHRNLKKLYETKELNGIDSNNYKICTSKDLSHPYFEYPKTSELFWHVTKILLKKIRQLIESKIYYDQWILLFSNSANSSPYNLSQYTRIIPPKDRFWADPFLIIRNNKQYLFIEELVFKDKLGHLAVMELDDKGNYTTPKIILKKEYHLSYPFLFEDKDNLFMIPETSGNNDIQLYKCTNFPHEWKLEKTLMNNVVALDTTIYKEGDIYWMFTNLKEHKGMPSNVNLFLYYSKDLVSNKWTSHPLNPVVTDVKKARPAGQLFKEGNNLVRPSQNCSHYYGYGMNFNKITKLTELYYEEEMLHSIDPGWQKNVLCTHTFNFSKYVYISDAKIKRNRFF
ncbi:hypothetical protein MWU78_15420 [Arenibacter sp. F26102]|uniref:glucosamine inositolphosphorylceramide transferase family protein n=1 Tax=Arenibacter sp. F26102 TaxID=2926416 RepID=UPI001FF14F34|nr:hypothetical protein [Arenibacter sp. F26102]MCK0147045.1 hypothetical protein [Arenibacter sp. F26102]